MSPCTSAWVPTLIPEAVLVVLAGLWGLALRWNCQHVQKLRGSQDLWPLEAAESQETWPFLLSSGKCSLVLALGLPLSTINQTSFIHVPILTHRNVDQAGGQYSLQSDYCELCVCCEVFLNTVFAQSWIIRRRLLIRNVRSQSHSSDEMKYPWPWSFIFVCRDFV